MLDSQEVYSRERKLRATFKNHLNSAHLQKVSNTLLQDLVKLPTLQPAYTVNGSTNFGHSARKSKWRMWTYR